MKEYREYVDHHLQRLLMEERLDSTALQLIELGIQHEQQHQELILTDLKHGFSFNPRFPALNDYQAAEKTIPEQRWLTYPGGQVSVGYDGPEFHYDNEGPRHEVLLAPFKLAQRLVTNSEYLEFVADGGYQNPLLWLSDGWAWLQQKNITQPLYWFENQGQWQQYTLAGLKPLNPAEPVCHISYYEADAYAQWRGKRLPTEHEWEAVAQQTPVQGPFLELTCLHPQPASETGSDEIQQLYGTCWQWTRSAYSPYPGFKPPAGAVGEYNGKFMCNQLVLRGGSCVTPKGHVRPSYRNFFPAHAQWQFTGIRMADDA